MASGRCQPGRKSWDGAERADKGDWIGLLLDIGTGTLTVFKNGSRLGVMATGLSGEYCWAASLFFSSAVRIRSAPAPAAAAAAAT